MSSNPQSPQVEIYHCMEHPSYHINFGNRPAGAGKEKKLDYQGTIAFTHSHPCSVLDGTCSASIDDIGRPRDTFETRTIRRVKVFVDADTVRTRHDPPSCAQPFGVSCSTIPVLHRDHRQK